MKCIKCKKRETFVTDSRVKKDPLGNPVIRRRRACPKCENRFTTYEVLEAVVGIAVTTEKATELLKICDDLTLLMTEMMQGPSGKPKKGRVPKKRYGRRLKASPQRL
jgi:transcriptional regulator NrdR family protein